MLEDTLVQTARAGAKTGTSIDSAESEIMHS
jgi:hypothetical protein